MQLFITDFDVKQNTISINTPEILNQVRKVLRLGKGDHITVQGISSNKSGIMIRYEIEITDRIDKKLTGTIVHQTNKIIQKKHKTGMIIGMPNKWEKVEIIVQKLTEIGLDEIIFWPSERSVIRQWNENKAQRLQKIAREAVEQSRGRIIPKIEFVTNIGELLKNKCVLVFDKMQDFVFKESKETKKIRVLDSLFDIKGQRIDYGIVGPEGGLTHYDYEHLKAQNIILRELGETLLRTETAAIIGGWLVKNQDNMT